MPVPAVVMAIPYIASAVMQLYQLFKKKDGGGKEAGQDYQDLLRNVPQLRETQEIQLNRLRRQEPLHEAAVRLAQSLTPRSGRGY